MSKDSSSPRAVLEGYRKSKQTPPGLAPLDLLVYSMLAHDAEPRQAWAAFKRLQEAFVDWNDCRVARRAELERLLEGLPESAERAVRLRDFLNRLFDQLGCLDLALLQESKATETKKLLLDVDSDLPRQPLNIVIFQLCQGVTLPITSEGLRIARQRGLVGRTGTKQQLQKAMLENLSSAEAGELLQYIETEAEPPAKPAKAKKAAGGDKAKTADKKKTKAKNKSKSKS